MATPRQLVSKLAELTGVPEGTVILHDRNLMTFGLRSLGVRGRGVSSVTYEDAANLLIAVAASRSVKDSVRTVVAYSALTASEPLAFDADVRGRTFGDALAAFLEAAPNSRHLFAGRGGGTIEVSIFGPNPAARIEWNLPESSGTIDYTGKRDPTFADLQFVSKFSQVTIGHIGDLVSN